MSESYGWPKAYSTLRYLFDHRDGSGDCGRDAGGQRFSVIKTLGADRNKETARLGCIELLTNGKQLIWLEVVRKSLGCPICINGIATDLAGRTTASRVDENDGAGPTSVFGELRRELMNTKSCGCGVRSPDFFRHSPGNSIVTSKRIAIADNQNAVGHLIPGFMSA